jgi:DNA-binding GntR family transcriptional regulator/predicted metal-dependent enzyme (double-stranded beta helix superfamily)
VPLQLIKSSVAEPKPARPLLNEIAFDRIKRDILTCVLGPSEQITEAQLADRYSLGRAPIRAALLGLAQGGLVRAIPRRGYVIAPITIQDVQDITQMRLLLEPTAARLASQHLTDVQLKRMEALCTVKCAPVDKFGERAIAAHRELHTLISLSCGNPRLADSIATLYDDVERLMHLGVSRVDAGEMSGYSPLVQALAAKDGEGAAQLMVDQIELGRKRILEALFSNPTQSEPRFGDASGESLSLAEFVKDIGPIVTDDQPAEVPLRVAAKLRLLLNYPKLLQPDQRGSSSQSYRRHVLYIDPDGRFSVLAVVWEAGQTTPVTRPADWSVTGVYEGELRETSYRRVLGSDGATRLLPAGVTHYYRGDIMYQSGLGHNLQRQDNPTAQLTISVHVYGIDVRSSGAGMGAVMEECYLADDTEPRT